MQFSEDDLRSALRRKDPSADFTAKVMASLAGSKTEAGSQTEAGREMEAVLPIAPAVHQSLWRMRWAVTGALAACLLVAGTSEYQMHRHKVEGEQAKAQAVRAMQITAAKMGHVFRRTRFTPAMNSGDHKEHL